MALTTGFDAGTVRTSISNVISAYEDLMAALVTDMQTKFIDGMADKWACTQAQTFFTGTFKPLVDDLISDSNTTFSSVVNAMNSAAKNWAISTGSEEVWSSVTFMTNSTMMNVEGILENIDGVRGIDLTLASEVVGTLPNIQTAASDALAAAASAVTGCGFIGGSQEESLVTALGNISTNINSAVETIIAQAKTDIESTITAYSDLQGKVSEAFSGQESQ